MCGLSFAGNAESAAAPITHWCLFTSQPRARVALQEKVVQLYLWAAADRASLEGARQTSTSNHWKLFLSSNVYSQTYKEVFYLPSPLCSDSHVIWSCGILDQRAKNCCVYWEALAKAAQFKSFLRATMLLLVSKPDLAAGRREDIKRHFPRSLDVFPLSRRHISSNSKLEDFLWAGKSSE